MSVTQWPVEDVADLTREDYELFRRLIYAKSGINLGDGKMQLVRARLGKRVRSGGFRSFREYYRHIENDAGGEELAYLLDAISTNTTHLFREIRHFNLLRETVQRWIREKAWVASAGGVLRIWCAASSSGEEPHSIAMTVHDALGDRPPVTCRILATDISSRMLERARRGVYEPHRLGTVPPQYRSRYFVRAPDGSGLQVAPEIADMIRFARFNLMTPTFPFRHGFHVIFCRNVMIYFDRPTQQTLIEKLSGQLRPGGLLMIGHSESLSGVRHPLEYVEPTVYRRK